MDRVGQLLHEKHDSRSVETGENPRREGITLRRRTAARGARVGLPCRSSLAVSGGGNEVLVKASLPVPFVSFDGVWWWLRCRNGCSKPEMFCSETSFEQERAFTMCASESADPLHGGLR